MCAIARALKSLSKEPNIRTRRCLAELQGTKYAHEGVNFCRFLALTQPFWLGTLQLEDS